MEDPVVLGVAEDLGLLERARTYRYAQQTLEAVRVGILKYDTPVLQEPAGMADALKKCVRFLAARVEPSGFQHILDIPADTAPGAQIKRLGYKTKDEYVTDAGEYLDWYLRGGYERERIIWSVSGKRELKPMSKLLANDIRLFVVPPVHFIMLQQQECADLDSKMKALADDPAFPIKIGMTTQHGGFQAQIEYLRRKYRYLVSSDVRKFDGAFALFLMRRVYKMRSLLRKQGLPTKALDKILEVLTNPEILLPTGELIRLLQGHLSGSGTTGHDGSYGHLLFQFWMGDVLGLVYGEDFEVLIGADDVVWASKLPLPLPARVWCYKQFGWSLKVEEDVMRGNTADGISFYGMTYCEEIDGGFPVHSKLDKIVSAFLQLESRMDLSPGRVRDRVLSLRAFCAFDDLLWEFAERIVRAYESRVDWSEFVVPNREYYTRFLWRDVEVRDSTRNV